MPELPEVETARRLAERVAAGRRIVRVWCAPDPIVFGSVSAARMRQALLGRRVHRVGRHGKHLWFELDRRPWPCIHFGMTGGLHAPRATRVRLVSMGTRDPGADWPPPFTKLRLHFDGGRELAMTDARRLGRIRLRQDPRAEPPISLLGFDALLSVPSPARFAGLLSLRAAPVKALLLDQSFAAGVGNWVADEILYQARIAPWRPARSLSSAEARRLRAALKSVVATAVAARADSDRFPRRWLFHHRWGRQAGATTARGEKIRHDVIGGRTTAWVPAVQR
ncbi:MAG TPA: DNA-formamidopyrimidine glycosylase family protein [Methylomirabilota bacterium]|jgi:formamidopyrimidine-DNA glycosylase|nr:DNA-formamidopyrimidine glycosylase family protein [Methylomirabilota bacterium]